MPLFLLHHTFLISENTIRSLISEKIAGTDYYILTVDVKPGNAIVVELESMGNVSIADCVDISRAIEHNLDREVEDFSLQVTSPGIDKPLRDFRQYIKNVGRKLRLLLSDAREMEGELVEADQEKIVLKAISKERVEGKKKRVHVETLHEIPYSQIKQARVKISFK